MKYRLGPTWMHSVNCMLLPTFVVYPSGNVQAWDRGALMLRFLWWGIGVNLYER